MIAIAIFLCVFAVIFLAYTAFAIIKRQWDFAAAGAIGCVVNAGGGIFLALH